VRLYDELLGPPVYTAYYQASAKCTDQKLKNKRAFDFLSAYKAALKEETGQYFSVFRDTDPLYRTLSMKEKLLELLPERLALLITTAVLSSPMGDYGSLNATIVMLDSIIEQNLEIIINNNESSGDLGKTLSEIKLSFDFKKSIELFYNKLESERNADVQNGELELLKLRNHLEEPGDKELLSIILDYINAANKDMPKNLKYFKRKNPVSHNDLKVKEKEAEKGYDLYRKKHLPFKRIQDAENFARAIDTLDKASFFKDAFDSAEYEQSNLFIQLFLLMTLKNEGFLYQPLPFPSELSSPEIKEGQAFFTPNFSLSCRQILSEIEGITFPFFNSCNVLAANEKDVRLQLKVFADFLLHEVFSAESSDETATSGEYIIKALHVFLKTNLTSPSEMLCAIISTSLHEIMGTLNTATQQPDGIDERVRNNLLFLWQALLDAWVVRLTFEKAKELAERRCKIVPAKRQLLESLQSDSDVDESLKETRASINKIYENLFGTAKKPKQSDYDKP
jgi:hypothetical protein